MTARLQPPSNSTRSRRALVIERFERRERARDQRRFLDLPTMAALYSKERSSRGDLDTAYHTLVRSLDDVGFLGTRILYLHPDVSPPYFRPPDRNPNPKAPLPPYIPHKTKPLITRSFIEQQIRSMGWDVTRDAYLARCWIDATCANRWLNSHGIAVPGLVARSSKDPSNKKSATPRPPAAAPTKRQRAAAAIAELRSMILDLSNTELVHRVSKHLTAKGLPPVSRDTILRAAKRRG
jgi:hypothetical protein